MMLRYLGIHLYGVKTIAAHVTPAAKDPFIWGEEVDMSQEVERGGSNLIRGSYLDRVLTYKDLGGCWHLPA